MVIACTWLENIKPNALRAFLVAFTLQFTLKAQRNMVIHNLLNAGQILNISHISPVN